MYVLKRDGVFQETLLGSGKMVKAVSKARGVTNQQNPHTAAAVKGASATAEGAAAPARPAINTQELVDGGFITVSAQIRELHRRGYTKGEISKGLGKIYQHVYNVLNKPLKKEPAAPTEQA